MRDLIGGHRYRWSGWFGCQLESWEWRTLPAGTRRKLQIHIDRMPVEMTVFTTQRQGLRVRTTWAVSSSGTHSEHNARIEDLRQQLRNIV
jgi:hypothetical protein